MGIFDRKSNDQSKSEADQLIERLGATIGEKIEAAVKPLRDKVEGIEGKWNKLEADAGTAEREEAERQRREAEGNLSPEEKQTLENRKRDIAIALTNARFTEENCIREIEGKWSGLVPEIRRILSTIPLEEKVKGDYPARCQNAVDLVIGRKAKEAGLSYDRNASKFFIEDAAADTGGDKSPLNDPDLAWTDKNGKTLTASDQLAKLHIDPKEFEKFMRSGAN